MNEYATQMSQSFENELQKIASSKIANKSWLLPAVAGSLATGLVVQAEKDRRLGRRVRVQQG